MNNNILIGHLGWDGCHFLAACLSMSDEVYFNHFTLRGKLEYFFKNLSTLNKVDGKPVWSDVHMFFGSSYQSNGYVHYRQLLVNDFDDKFEQFSPNSNPEQKTLVSRLHIPIYYPLSDMMEKNVLHPIVDMFRSKYFICLVNTKLFASLRSIKIEHDTQVINSWDEGFATIPDIKWYDGTLTNVAKMTNSLTVSEFQNLSKEVKETLKFHHNNNLDDLFNLTELYKTDNDLLKTFITHQWDCNWFLDEDETIDNLKVLYSEMNLGQVNEKLIRKMYKMWINKIDYIKKWYMGYESDDVSFQSLLPPSEFFSTDRCINHT
jgi:hypothetical protein